MFTKIIKKIRYELQFKNTDYYERINDKLFKRIYQRILRLKLNSLEPIVLQKQNAKLTLATLSNKKRFYESVAALYSFCFWERNICIHYHEDGTLTENEISYLEKTFQGITIFRRSDQNLKIKNHLLSKGLNHSAQLRDQFFLSIKLFDMVNERRTPYLLHIDSDVLFFSRPGEILDIVEKGNLNGCFNVDVNNDYTFDDVSMAKYMNLSVITHFNSGLLLHNFDEGIFDFVNTVMEDNATAVTSWHLEQTLLAMYATIQGNFLALPKQYDLQRRERDLGNKIVSEHYVQGTAYDFHKDFIYKLFPQYTR
jgi:hypothetical protein